MIKSQLHIFSVMMFFTNFFFSVGYFCFFLLIYLEVFLHMEGINSLSCFCNIFLFCFFLTWFMVFLS